VNKVLAEAIGGDDDGDIVKFAPALFILSSARRRLDNIMARQTGKGLIYKFFWETGIASKSFATKMFGSHAIAPTEEVYSKIVEEIPAAKLFRKIRTE